MDDVNFPVILRFMCYSTLMSQQHDHHDSSKRLVKKKQMSLPTVAHLSVVNIAKRLSQSTLSDGRV